MPSERLQKLMEMLQRTPADAFLLYGIAMEYKKLGEMEQALAYFDKTLAADSGYCYAYYQKAQTFELMGDTTAARQAYLQGIEVAQRAGDAHAQGELETALAMMG